MKARGGISALVPIVAASPDLVQLHEELVARLAALDEDFEILYLLGTGDAGTVARVRQVHGALPEKVRVLEFAHTVDEAAMLSAGVEKAHGEILMTVPSRFETSLSVLPTLYQAVRDGADLAQASRRRGSVAGAARLQSQIFNRLVSWATGSRFRDIASGTRALRREVVEEIPLYGDFHRYLPLLAERVGFRVREVPADQHRGASAPVVHRPSIYLWRGIDILSVLFIGRFTRYPLRLFGGVGAGFAAVGGVILVVLAVQRLLGTPLADRPLLLLGALLIGLGVQAFTIGLLGELVLFFHARRQRDYRVAAVHEASQPASEAPAAGSRAASEA